MHPPAWWPVSDGEAIGEERAGELVRWLQIVAPPAVAAAHAHLRTRSPDARVKTYALTVQDLARKVLAPTMRGVSIGVVWTPGFGAGADVVGIAVTREGQLALTIREPGETVQRWVMVAEPTTARDG